MTYPTEKPLTNRAKIRRLEITADMIEMGVKAFEEYDSEVDEPEALVFAILYRARRLMMLDPVAKAATLPE